MVPGSLIVSVMFCGVLYSPLVVLAVAVGGTVSIVYVCVYIGLVFPAVSIARYFNVVAIFDGISIGPVYWLLVLVGFIPS